MENHNQNFAIVSFLFDSSDSKDHGVCFWDIVNTFDEAEDLVKNTLSKTITDHDIEIIDMYKFVKIDDFKNYKNCQKEYFRSEYHSTLFDETKKNQQDLDTYIHELQTKKDEKTVAELTL